MESLQHLARLQRLESIKNLDRLQRFVGDYREVKIEQDAVIYCDIPYRGTVGYGVDFDHEAFYDWCEKQSQPVFISEYWMPEERFKCIAEFNHTNTFSSSGNKKVTERVFVPLKQYRGGLQQSLF